MHTSGPSYRDEIKRHARWVRWFAAAGGAGLGGGVTVASAMITHPGGRVQHAVFMACVLAFMIGTFGMVMASRRVICPKCHSLLGFMTGSSVFGGISYRAIKFCPYCAVNLDEPVPHK